MKNFIINIIDVLKDNNSTISSIKTYKKGVLPPLPVFPALSVLPISESYNYNYSNGKYRVNREVNLEIYIKSISLKNAREQLRDLIENVKTILTENYTIEGLVDDLHLRTLDFDDPLSFGDSILQRGVITINGFTYENKPSDRLSDSSISEATENQIIDELKDMFITYKDDATYPLNTIKSLNVQTIAPQVAFPAVLIAGSLASQRYREYTGLDVLDMTCEISVFTKLVDKDYALYTNLDIAENIKRNLQRVANLNGYLLDPEIERINYYRSFDGRLGLIYQSSLMYRGRALSLIDNDFSEVGSGCIDADGNEYEVVKIGNQIWMAENLRTTKYQNGDSIIYVPSGQSWSSSTEGRYGLYNDNSGLLGTYGLLYNFAAVEDSRGIAPDGWRVPTKEDADELVAYLGGEAVAGGKLKEIGTSNWNTPNTGATDEVGFTGLPSGQRNIQGTDDSIGEWAVWWVNEIISSIYVYTFDAVYNGVDCYVRQQLRRGGRAIRCIKET